jgi:hypothetical protein
VKAETRVRALHAAEVIDSMRVFPRLFLASAFAWGVWITYQILMFYFHLPAAERTEGVSLFCGGVQGAVLAFVKFVFDRYSMTSRDWNQQPMQTVTTVAASTTTATTGVTP